MNISNIKDKLSLEFPGKSVFEKVANGDVIEVICETKPTSDHPKYSTAIAIIDRSQPHYHKQTTETYKILKGKLTLHLEGEIIELNKGDKYTGRKEKRRGLNVIQNLGGLLKIIYWQTPNLLRMEDIQKNSQKILLNLLSLHLNIHLMGWRWM